jgi:dissimilatory sulfite reductase related protein
MTRINLNGQDIEVDDHGFMVDTSKWNEDIARAFAQQEGINELTENHWKVINYLRDYFFANSQCPMIRRLTKDSGLTLKQLYDLFPEGPALSACKWAGVPKSTGCS